MKNYIRIFKEDFWCGKGCGLSIRSIFYIAYMSIVIAYKSSKPLPLMYKLLSAYVSVICGNINEVYKNPKKFKNKFFRRLRNAFFELNYKWVDEDLYSFSEWHQLLKKHSELKDFYSKREQLCERIKEIACDDLRWNYETIEKFWDWCERDCKKKEKEKKRKRR